MIDGSRLCSFPPAPYCCSCRARPGFALRRRAFAGRRAYGHRGLEPQQLAQLLRALDAHALALTQGLEERLTLPITPELLSSRWTGPLAQLAAEHPLLDVEVLVPPQADALAVVTPGHALLDEAGQPNGLGALQLANTRQVVIAGRDDGVADPRVVFGRHVWHTDSPESAMSLLEAGLGWGWLPTSLVQERPDRGRLVALPLKTMDNGMALCVDVVWSRERPLGLGGALVEGMARARAA